MDKKKIQKFIDELQKMASEINDEMPKEQTLDLEEGMNEAKHGIAVSEEICSGCEGETAVAQNIATASANADTIDPNLPEDKKQYTLAGNVKLTVKLSDLSEMFAFDDVEEGSTTVGVGVSHVFNPMSESTYYGFGYKLNLYERFKLIKMAGAGPISVPVYTDAAGNKFTFTVLYYKYVNGEKKYLTSNEINDIKYTSPTNMTHDNTKVYYNYIKVNNYKYLQLLPGIILNNVHYMEMQAEDNNSAYFPNFWIKVGKVYKGFNYAGNLVMIIDSFGNYTDIEYDSSGRIISVGSEYSRYIQMTYNSSGNLQKITDARGRKIEYTYFGALLTSVSFYTANNEKYKTITLTYDTDDAGSYTIYSITCSDNTKTQILHGQEDYVKRLNIINYAAKPENTSFTNAQQVSSLVFVNDSMSKVTTITDEDNNQEKYVFNGDGSTIAYYAIYNGLVSKAEYYNYIPFKKRERIIITEKIMNQYTYAEFIDSSKVCKDHPELCSCCTCNNGEDCHECGDCDSCYNCIKCAGCVDCADECIINYSENTRIYMELSACNLPVNGSQSPIYLTDRVTKGIFTHYDYDDEFRVKKETSQVIYGGGTTYKIVTDYTYDPGTWFLTKKETTVTREGYQESTKDLVDTEEYEYDYYGSVTKIKSYRKQGTSTTANDIYYTQRTYNNKKQLIKEYDATGQYSSSINYAGYSNLVSGVTAPENNVLNYSYDNEDRLAKMYGTADRDENANANFIEYISGETQTLNHSGNNPIKYEYDAKRRPVRITISGEEYETYEYVDGSLYDCVTVTNANEETFKAETEKYGKYEKVYYNGSLILQRDYDKYGKLTKVTDSLAGIVQNYTTDLYGNLTKYTESKSGTTVLTQTISYDGKAQLSKVVYSGQVTRTDAYTYNGTYIDYVTKITTGNFTIMPKQDVDERYTGKTVAVNGTTVDAETLTYVKQGDHLTNMPKQITYPDTNISYTYDGNGNITKIMQGGVLQAQYSYDTLGRLIREDNNALGKSYFYTYDNNGNITAKEYCAFTTGSHTLGTGTVTLYAYNKDHLTKFGIESCVYDKIGNPTTYRGKTASWTRGRKLISYNGNAFSYDAQGRRISKNGITYVYDSNGRLMRQSNGLEFFYDTTGLAGLTYNGTAYVYRKDVQGNIIAILDSSGNKVVEYKYDAWGYHTISGSNTTLGNLNPFRYRSYYFDTETELYFLQTRYYDPVVGRFINMDSIDYADPESINGLNLYAYCGNNPVMNVDPDGTAWWQWLVGAVVIVGLAIATAATGGAAGGVAGFILAGALKGAVIGAVTSAAIGGTIGGIQSAIEGNGFWEGFENGASAGFMSGAIIGGITGAISSGAQVANAAKSWISSSGKTSFQQMTEHYTKHVINEGQKAVAKNIVNYTNQAKAFFANNSVSGYLIREGVIKIAGAPGGIFNLNGLIRSFWYVL